MNKKVLLIVIVIIAAVAIPVSVYTISPLFINNTINEPLPRTAAVVSQKEASQQYQKFISMNEKDKMNVAKQMSQKEKNMVMIGAAQINNTINENISTAGKSNNQHTTTDNNNTVGSTNKILTGSFVGAGDGFHNAKGIVKIIPLEYGSNVLRLENFKSTNGPNVHVYLSTDKSASDFVDLGRLKANNGNQNYDIPNKTNLSKYKTVLIWCKDFSVLFGSAELST
jgi:Electron transfer DM13